MQVTKTRKNHLPNKFHEYTWSDGHWGVQVGAWLCGSATRLLFADVWFGPSTNGCVHAVSQLLAQLGCTSEQPHTLAPTDGIKISNAP